MKKLYFYLGVVALFCSCNDILQDGNMDGLQSMPDNGKEESIEQQILHIIEGFNGGNDQSLQTRALGNNDEIEFLISKDGNVYPVEVKARRGSTVSLNRYISKFHPVTAYKLIDGNVGREGEKLTIPHYFAAFL